MFHLCAEYYSGSGRLSRTWIAEGPQATDTPTPCDPTCMAYSRRDTGSCGADGCIPYPFNGMGGVVIGTYPTKVEAEQVEAHMWDEPHQEDTNESL